VKNTQVTVTGCVGVQHRAARVRGGVIDGDDLHRGVLLRAQPGADRLETLVEVALDRVDRHYDGQQNIHADHRRLPM
jgi:hypothetical protein